MPWANWRRTNSGNCINRKPPSPLSYEWCTQRGKVTASFSNSFTDEFGHRNSSLTSDNGEFRRVSMTEGGAIVHSDQPVTSGSTTCTCVRFHNGTARCAPAFGAWPLSHSEGVHPWRVLLASCQAVSLSISSDFSQGKSSATPNWTWPSVLNATPNHCRRVGSQHRKLALDASCIPVFMSEAFRASW